MSRQYSREELLQALQDLAAELNRTPSKSDLNQDDTYPSPTPYYREFESLTVAVETAGLDPNQRGGRENTYSREKLLHYISELADELGRPPTKHEMKKKDGFPSPDTYYDRFKSWTDAVEAAGLEPSNHGSRYSHAELAKEVQAVVENLGRVPTQQEMRVHGEISPDVYHDRFGSWIAALEELGYEPVGTSKIPIQQLKEELHRLTDELEHAPTRDEMREHGKYGSDAYRRAFGSWNNALQECGIEPAQKKNLDDEELIQYIRDLAKKLDRTPSKQDLIEDSTSPSITPYYTRFGSWTNAVKQAGLEPNTEGGRTPTSREELINEIQRIGERLGRAPTKNDLYRDEKSPSQWPYYREFESWTDAVEAAGFEPNTGPTEIERILYGILDEFAVQYETEVKVVDNFPVDVVLSDKDVVIEADGMRWHGHPNRQPYDETQRIQIKRDGQRDQIFAEEGYHVVRFWGSTLKNNRDSVIQTIQNIVNGEDMPDHGKHVFGPEPRLDVKKQRENHELTDFFS